MLLRLVPLLLLLLAGCSFPTHLAHGVQDFTVPAAELTGLRCITHNGNITLQGANQTSAVHVRVRFSVRGYTAEEAEANLRLLTVRRDQSAGWLHLEGIVPEDLDGNLSPQFDFTVELPAALASDLHSHNGELEVRAMRGVVTAATHNGSTTVHGPVSGLHLQSHNGDITAVLDGDGPVPGDVETHNGSIDLSFGPGRAVAVTASTHNGSVELAGAAWQVQEGDAGVLRASRGQGAAPLTARSHNGDVTLR